MSRVALPGVSAAPSEPSHRVLEQAAEWFALLRSGGATDDDRARWHAWLERSPECRQAWGYVEAVGRSFAPIQTTTDPRRTADNLWAANQRVAQRRRLLAGIAALAGSGLLGTVAWRQAPSSVVALAWADYRSATGEVREVLLPDGTHVWLNTASAFDEDYTSARRRLYLRTGEILVDTAGDLRRPFFVDTPQGRLRALGTRFVVRLGDKETFLAVYEGAVEVRPTAGKRTVIRAGEQTRFTTGGAGVVEMADATRDAWSRGVLIANDMPLGHLAEELRRYRRGYLGVADEVADLRVFGSFPLRDTDGALDMLVTALPVRIKRTLPWWVSIEADGEAAR